MRLVAGDHEQREPERSDTRGEGDGEDGLPAHRGAVAPQRTASHRSADARRMRQIPFSFVALLLLRRGTTRRVAVSKAR